MHLGRLCIVASAQTIVVNSIGWRTERLTGTTENKQYIYIYTPTPLCGLQRRRIASLLPPLWSPTLENCAAHCARHARHNERNLPKVLYKHAWDSIDAEAEALQLGEMCGVGHLLLNDGD